MPCGGVPDQLLAPLAAPKSMFSAAGASPMPKNSTNWSKPFRSNLLVVLRLQMSVSPLCPSALSASNPDNGAVVDVEHVEARRASRAAAVGPKELGAGAELDHGIVVDAVIVVVPVELVVDDDLRPAADAHELVGLRHDLPLNVATEPPKASTLRPSRRR